MAPFPKIQCYKYQAGISNTWLVQIERDVSKLQKWLCHSQAKISKQIRTQIILKYWNTYKEEWSFTTKVVHQVSDYPNLDEVNAEDAHVCHMW